MIHSFLSSKHENVLNNYKENDPQLSLKQALDSISKDLKQISKYDFDAKCREKAESIIVNWKVCLRKNSVVKREKVRVWSSRTTLGRSVMNSWFVPTLTGRS